ncbi:HYR domain-containing protein, partial [Salegentibacter chungangensis]
GSINGTTTDPLSYSNQGTYTIVWTFTDSEGNSSTQNQTVIVDDTTAPEEINIPDAVGQCSVKVSTPSTNDNCSGEITGITTDDLFYDEQGEYQVTWTFDDGNGNITEIIQNVIVDDTAAPSPISIPDAIGECEVTVTAPVTTDDCSGDQITGTTTDPLTYTEQGDYQITWTFDDGNGNTTQAVQNVYVNDITAPETIEIADATAECEVTVTAPTTLDNCEGEITGTTTDPLTYTEQGDYLITWTFDDGNGNTTQAVQNVYVDDITAPETIEIADATAECEVIVTAPTTQDNCEGEITGTTTDPLTYTEQGDYQITWTFDDGNGNTTQAVQNVYVNDTTAPESIEIADVTGECEVSVTAPTTQDNCEGEITGTTTDPLTYTEQGDYQITWTFDDGNGNTTQAVQNVYVNDITAPESIEIANATGECEVTVTAPTTQDNCKGEITGTTTDPLTYTEQGDYQITWTFDDGNGNTTQAVQNVYVDDTTAPESIEIADAVGQCSVSLGTPVTNDNCEGQITGTTNDPLFYDEQGEFEVIWTFDDGNGNTTQVIQNVIVDDTAAPSPVIIPDAIAECEITVTAPVTTDDCSGEEITGTTTDPLTYTEQGEYQITWTFDDGNGNIIESVQNVIIKDNTAPDAIEIPDARGECAVTVIAPTTQDNCEGEITGTTTDLLTYTEQGEYQITWTFDDGNGNTTQTVQNVFVEDVTAPESIVIADAIGECDVNVTAPVTQDNCKGEITGTTTDPLTYTEQGEYQITWTFDDENGNTIQRVQNVFVNDTTGPEAPEIADATGQCSVSVETPVTNDNCSGEITGTTNDLLFYDEQGTYEVEWTFEDGNGNTTIVVQNVIVDDTMAPAPIEIADATGECEVNLIAPVTTDECSGEEIVGTTNDPLSYTEQGEYQVTWVFDDGNGNTTEVVQNVIVKDVTAPESIEIADATGECEVNLIAPLTQDNCEGEMTATTNDPLSYTEQGGYQVTWIFDDGNGNTTEVIQNVIVDDVTAPESIEIADATGECEVNLIAPVTQDNCEGEMTATTNDPLSYTEQGEYQVTWVFDDGNGNTTEVVQNVIVNDVTAPEFTEVSDIAMNVDAGKCGAIVNYEIPTASDNCEISDNQLIEGLQPGSEFPVGTTLVTYQVTDVAGNMDSVSFNVIITDNIDPSIECSTNITTSVAFGESGITVDYETPVFSDNCPDVTIEQTEGLASGSVFPVGSTTNTFVVTDASGNTVTCSFSVTVDEEPAAPSVSIIQPDCDTATGSISVETTAGLTYSIDGENYRENGNFTQLTAGSYTITARDENGYISPATTVVINAQPSTPAAPVIEERLETTCTDPTASIMLSLVDGISFSLETGDGSMITDEDEDGIFEGLTAGDYNVYAQNTEGCISEAKSFSIEAPESSNIEEATVNLCIGDFPYDLFELFPEGNDLTGEWTDTEETGALTDNILDPALLEVGTYTFTYQTTGECATTTTITANIDDDCVVVLPCALEDISSSISKAVTPNGDGHNDYFEIDFANECGFVYDLMIFNRWGAKIFESNNYQNNWDGFSTDSFTSSDQLPSGTYYYVLEIRNSGFEPIQGYIYLGTK